VANNPADKRLRSILRHWPLVGVCSLSHAVVGAGCLCFPAFGKQTASQKSSDSAVAYASRWSVLLLCGVWGYIGVINSMCAGGGIGRISRYQP
jgi:hypothetical protein